MRTFIDTIMPGRKTIVFQFSNKPYISSMAQPAMPCLNALRYFQAVGYFPIEISLNISEICQLTGFPISLIKPLYSYFTWPNSAVC